MPPKKGSTGRPKSTTAKSATLPDIVEAPVFWPIWDDEALQKEVWEDGPANKGKDKIKFPFEDDPQVVFPHTIQSKIVSWKRLSEIEEAGEDDGASSNPTVLVDTSRFKKATVKRETTQTEAAYLRRKKLQVQEKSKEPDVSLTTSNKHLMDCELMRWIIAYLDILQRAPRVEDPHNIRAWELIYPQDNNQIPTLNPGGKYCVKLFWLGSWRSVCIDDAMPQDKDGNFLLPTTSIQHEMWAAILAKAICKVAALNYSHDVTQPDFGEADVLQMLTGWIPQQTAFFLETEMKINDLTSLLSTSIPDEIKKGEVDVVPQPESRPPGPAPSESSASISSATSSSSKKRGSKSRSGRKSSSAADNEPKGPYPRVAPNDHPVVFAYYSAHKTIHAEEMTEVGLTPSTSHPVRVRSCEHIPTLLGKTNASDKDNEEDWILELESSLALFRGRLGYEDKTSSWKTAYQVALGTSREAETLAQEQADKCEQEGVPHAPFRWRMYLSDFKKIFDSVIVYRKQMQFPNIALIHGEADGTPVLVNDPCPTEPEVEVTNDWASVGQPWLLHIDSAENHEIVISLSVGPLRAPRYPTSDEDEASRGANSTVLPQNGYLLVTKYDWMHPHQQEIVVSAQTAGTQSFTIPLPAGRHVFSLTVSAVSHYSISCYASRQFVVGNELRVLKVLSEGGVRLTKHAITTLQTIGLLVEQEDKKTREQIVEKMTLLHQNMKIDLSSMAFFWESFLWSLEQGLQDQGWKNSEGDLALGKDWTGYVQYLKELFINEYQKHEKAESVADTDVAMTEEQAATVIQRNFRGFSVRKESMAQRADQVKAHREAIQESWKKLCTNITDLGVLCFRRLFEISPEVRDTFSFADDEKVYTEVIDLPLQFAGQAEPGWTVMSLDTVVFSCATKAALRIVIPEEAIGVAVTLSITDNKTGEEVPSVFGQPQPFVYQPHEEGYTIVVYVLSGPTAIPATEFSMRVVSCPSFPHFGSEETSKLTTEVTTQRFCEECKPLKNDLFFRYTLTPSQAKQWHLFSFTVNPSELPNAILHMDLLHGDEIIRTVAGKGGVVLPLVGLEKPVEEPPTSEEEAQAGDENIEVKEETSEEANEKGEDSEEPEKNEEPEEAKVFTEPTPEPAPVVEYILVGRISGNLLGAAAGNGAATAVASPSKDSGKKKEKRSKSAAKKRTGLPQWTLVCAGEAEVTITPDRKRFEEIEGIKSAWEAADPGRKEKAQELRNGFMTSDKKDASGVVIKASDSPQIIDEELVYARESALGKKLKEFKSVRQDTKASRKGEVEGRETQKADLTVGWRKQQAQHLVGRQEALQKREALRSRIAEEREAQRLAAEAAEAEKLASEQAESGGSPSRAKSRSGKKKK